MSIFPNMRLFYDFCFIVFKILVPFVHFEFILLNGRKKGESGQKAENGQKPKIVEETKKTETLGNGAEWQSCRIAENGRKVAEKSKMFISLKWLKWLLNMAKKPKIGKKLEMAEKIIKAETIKNGRKAKCNRKT